MSVVILHNLHITFQTALNLKADLKITETGNGNANIEHS